MAIDPKTGLDLNIKVQNPTLKKEVSQEKPKIVTPPKGFSVTSYLNRLGINPSPRNVNLVGVDDSRYNQNLAASEIQAGNLEKTRSENQPWSHEAANAIVRLGGEIVGGGIEVFGIINELLKGNKLVLDTENVLVNLGRDLKQSANKEFKIYNTDPGGSMLTSSENFFENIISLGSSLSMMIPVAGSFRLVGGLGKLAKGMSIGKQALGILGNAGKLNKYQKWVAGGLSQASLSRHIESNLEAYGTYESLIKEGLSKEEAEKAALDVYSKNWIMLLQDIPQYLAFGKVFNPMTGKFVKNATKMGSKIKPKYAKALGLAGVSVSEVGEEAFQYIVAQEAEYGAKVQAGLIDYKSASERNQEYFSDDNFWNAMIMGAAGGAIFQTVMPKLQGGQSKSQEEKIQKQYLAARGGIFKNLAEMIDQADQTNDEAVQIRIRRKANNLLIQNALINDRYEEHLEWLETLENLTPEQQQQLEQEESIKLSNTVISKVVPKLKEESEAVRNEFLKHVNKHGVNKASLIALNQVDLQNQKEYVKQAYDNYTKIKNDVLTDETGSNILDPISQEFFDLTLDENAYTLAKAIKIANISNNPNFSDKQKEIEIENVEKNYEAAKTNIDKKRKEIVSRDKRTSDEKQKVTETFKNLNDKKEETKERELVKFRARHLSQKDELKRLEREKSYLNSSQFEFDKITSENLNEINKTDDLNKIRELGNNLEKNGQLNTIINKYRQKEKEIANKLNEDLQKIAKTVSDKAKQNNTNETYEISSLSKEDRYIVDRYKSQFNKVLASLKTPTKPKETSKVETRSSGKEVNRKMDVSFVIPNDAPSSELSNYVDWLNQPVSYEDYTAVITRTKNQKEEYEYRVTFKDKQGNLVIHKDKEVFTWLSTLNKNPKISAFKASIDNNLDSNNQAFIKVKKQEVPDIQNTNENNDIHEVFGNDVELIYTDAEGNFVPFGKKSKDEVAKVVNNRLGTKNPRAGLVYAITKDINGDEIPIKLNTPLLGRVKNAAEVIYEIYRNLLLKGVENMQANVPQELLDMLKFDTTHFTNDKGEVTYTDLLDQLVYDSPNTRGTSSNLDSQKEWVYFGNDGINYYTDGNEVKVNDVLTPRSSSIKDDSILTYMSKNNKDYVKIQETGEIVEVKLRKGRSYKLTPENVINDEMKSKFIDFINNNKRFNIKVIKSNEYLATLVSEKLLTTDKRKGAIFEPIVDYKSKGMLYVDPTKLSKKEQTLKESEKPTTGIEDSNLQSNPEGVDNSNLSIDEIFPKTNVGNFENTISDAQLEAQKVYAEQEATSKEVEAARAEYAKGQLEELSDLNNYEDNQNKVSSQSLQSKSEDMLDNVKNVSSVSETNEKVNKSESILDLQNKLRSKLKGVNKESAVNTNEGERTMADVLAKRRSLKEAKKNNNESKKDC